MAFEDQLEVQTRFTSPWPLVYLEAPKPQGSIYPFPKRLILFNYMSLLGSILRYPLGGRPLHNAAAMACFPGGWDLRLRVWDQSVLNV